MRFLYETGSIDEHTQLWWSVRPHLAFPTVEIRICDAQPDLAESQALAALAYCARRAHRARARRGRAAPDQPHRLIEENMWRAIRYGLSGRLLDLGRGEVRPARAALERLLEWVAPVADEIGAAPYLALPRAERRRAADRPLRGGRVAGGDLRRAGQGGGVRSVADEQITEEELLEELRPSSAKLKVSDLLVQTLSPFPRSPTTELSGRARDLEQARLAIDALRALVPVLAGSIRPGTASATSSR